MIVSTTAAAAAGRSVPMFARRFRQSDIHSCIPVRRYRWFVILVVAVARVVRAACRRRRCSHCCGHRGWHSVRWQGRRNVVIAAKRFAMTITYDYTEDVKKLNRQTLREEINDVKTHIFLLILFFSVTFCLNNGKIGVSSLSRKINNVILKRRKEK